MLGFMEERFLPRIDDVIFMILNMFYSNWVHFQKLVQAKKLINIKFADINSHMTFEMCLPWKILSVVYTDHVCKVSYFCLWAGAPSCYLDLLDKLQKQICRIVGPSLAASLEPLAHCGNVASLSLFYRYYSGRCSSELAQLVPLPFSQFLDAARMSMSTVSFLTQLDSGTRCL